MLPKHLIEEVVVDQEEESKRRSAMREVPREALAKARAFAKLPHTVVVAGIRRCGKSTLLAQIRRNLTGGGYFINFEDERLTGFGVEDFRTLHEVCMERFGEKKAFFFDEIQNVQGWERFVNRMYRSGAKFYLTGSNAALLSREFGTKLTGRHVTLPLHPFSFREYLTFAGYERGERDLLRPSRRASLKRHFHLYLREGGMPEYLQTKSRETLMEVYHDILYRDIVARYDIRDELSLRELALYLVSNHAALFSFNGLKKFLRLGSVNTVRQFVSYLENSFLFSTTARFSYSLKQQAVAPKKVYCIDPGFIRALAVKFSEDRGRLLENVVWIEFKRRGEGEIYYYRTERGREVDLALRRGGAIDRLVQVCWSLSEPRTRELEVGSLLEAMDELKVPRAIILTDDERETIRDGKRTIQALPVYQWLLEDWV